jgi:hypothetical protein
MTRAAVCLVSSVLIASSSACGGEEVTPCGRLEVRYLECGLIHRGPIQCDEPRTRLEGCEAACFTEASCAELAQFSCNMGLPAAIAFCQEECESDQSFFQCADGSRVFERHRCNGGVHCPDGSDELGCATFACADGTMVAERLRCDERAHCADGSDELGCPSSAVCPDGSAITDAQRCNGFADCADGRDEGGCLICPG